MAGPLVSPISSRRESIGLVDRYSETFFRIPVPVIFHSIAPRREKQTSARSAIITLSHPNHGKRVLFYIDEAPTNNCFLLSGAFQMFAINRCNKNFKLWASVAFSGLSYIEQMLWNHSSERWFWRNGTLKPSQVRSALGSKNLFLVVRLNEVNS